MDRGPVPLAPGLGHEVALSRAQPLRLPLGQIRRVVSLVEVEMQVRAIAKNIGISPRKMRLVTNSVKGLRVNEALAILQFLPNAGATPVSKVVASAAANAENNYNLNPDELYILNIVADDSFRIKRGKARSHGRATRIVHRFCHVTVIVSDDPADTGR